MLERNTTPPQTLPFDRPHNNNDNNNNLIYIAPACRMTSEALADSFVILFHPWTFLFSPSPWGSRWNTELDARSITNAFASHTHYKSWRRRWQLMLTDRSRASDWFCCLRRKLQFLYVRRCLYKVSEIARNDVSTINPSACHSILMTY